MEEAGVACRDSATWGVKQLTDPVPRLRRLSFRQVMPTQVQWIKDKCLTFHPDQNRIALAGGRDIETWLDLRATSRCMLQFAKVVEIGAKAQSSCHIADSKQLEGHRVPKLNLSAVSVPLLRGIRHSSGCSRPAAKLWPDPRLDVSLPADTHEMPLSISCSTIAPSTDGQGGQKDAWSNASWYERV